MCKRLNLWFLLYITIFGAGQFGASFASPIFEPTQNVYMLATGTVGDFSFNSDELGLFGPAGGSLAGQNYTMLLTFDKSKLISDTVPTDWRNSKANSKSATIAATIGQHTVILNPVPLTGHDATDRLNVAADMHLLGPGYHDLFGGTVAGNCAVQCMEGALIDVQGENNDFLHSDSLDQNIFCNHAMCLSSPEGHTINSSPQVGPPPGQVPDAQFAEYSKDGSKLTLFNGSATCVSLGLGMFNVSYNPGQPSIAASFTPNCGLSLDQLASLLGVDHFNWVQNIYSYPGSLCATYHFPYGGYDPPSGGTICQRADDEPYYYDETQKDPEFYIENPSITQNDKISFDDAPGDVWLIGDEYMQFVTSLVGVRDDGSFTQPLFTFEWKSNHNPLGGGGVSRDDEESTEGGTGGVYDVVVLDDPMDVSPDVEQLWFASGMSIPVAANPDDVPEPTALVLFGAGVACLSLVRLKRI